VLSVRIQPVRRDLEILLDRTLSPEAQSAAFARFARQALAEGKATNERVLGRVPSYRTFVDGQEGASEDRVRPAGRIVYEFELVSDIPVVALAELERFSPHRSGRYQNSHVLFADGVQVSDPKNAPPAREWVIMNLTAYARKIEGTVHSGGKRPPQSRQAPDGVYNVVADRLQRQYGNVARIRFSYRSAIGGAGGADRNPCIVIGLR